MSMVAGVRLGMLRVVVDTDGAGTGEEEEVEVTQLDCAVACCRSDVDDNEFGLK